MLMNSIESLILLC